MKLIFLGAPGSGKGTIAKILSKELNIPHISTGDIFRKEMKDKTSLGIKIEKDMHAGKLVSDEDTIAIVKKRLNEKDCDDGFILDGFPRTLKQAEALDKITKIDIVINYYADEDLLIRRLLARRSCPNCKKEYNLITVMKPKNNNEECDVCKVKLVKRSDDNEKVIRDRQEIYKKETKPLIDYYKKKNILKAVENIKQPVEVAEETLKHIL